MAVHESSKRPEWAAWYRLRRNRARSVARNANGGASERARDKRSVGARGLPRCPWNA